MTKEELINEVNENKNNYICKDAVRDVCETAIQVITNAIKQGDDITIRGLGTLKVVTSKAKKAQDITHGRTIDIPARKTVKFKVSKKLKETINHGK